MPSEAITEKNLSPFPITGESTLCQETFQARLFAGEEEAFVLLVKTFQDPLTNYLTRLSGSRERAQDIAQDAFLRFFRVLAKGNRRALNLKAYLFRIATNLLWSEERRARRFQWVAALIQTEKRPSSSDAPQGQCPRAHLLREETQQQLAQALTQLPLRYRVPLVLREIEHWTYQEIAAFLKLNEGTVKSRVHRGKARLKKRLAPYWFGGDACP